MKYKNLLLTASMVLCLVFALSIVSAAVDVTYNAYYAEFEDDGGIDYTTTVVEDFTTVGYVCTDAACSTVGAQIPGLTDSSGVGSNSVTLTYPTDLQDPNGYGVWFSKDGYIGYERSADWYGTGTASDEYNVYFARKESGWAPVMDLNVEDTVSPGTPLTIGATVAIDADTYSALENAGPLEYEPAQVAGINSVETDITLEIRDSTSVLYEDTQTIQIPYSGVYNAQWTDVYAFASQGEYEVRVYTDVSNDPKILNDVSPGPATSEIMVVDGALDDYTYAEIDGLDMTPAHPDIDDTIVVTFDYASYDISGGQSNEDTDVQISLYRDGDRIDRETATGLAAGTYTYNSPVLDREGSYRIIVDVDPSATGVNGAFGASQEIRFLIGEEGDSDDDDDDEFEDDGELKLMIKPKSTGSTIGGLDLRPDESLALRRLKIIMWTLFWLILALIILIIIVAAVKAGKEDNSNQEVEE